MSTGGVEQESAPQIEPQKEVPLVQNTVTIQIHELEVNELTAPEKIVVELPSTSPPVIDQLISEVPDLIGYTKKLAKHFGVHESDSEDVAQKAFERVLRIGHKFRGESSAKTWFFTVVRSVSSNHFRAKQSIKQHLAEDITDLTIVAAPAHEKPEHIVVETDDNNHRKEIILAALGTLSAAAAVIIIKRLLEDKSHGEIAKELGISETAAKVRFHRAFKQLKPLIEQALANREEN